MTNLSRRRLLKYSACLSLLSGSLITWTQIFAEKLSLSSAHLQWLASKIGGTLIARNQPDFEEVRKSMVWQRLKPTRYPVAIVKISSVKDIQEAIVFARDNGLKVSVRCGGHNFSGVVLEQDSLLLDISGLVGIEVDVDNKIASVGPGVSGAELLWKLEQNNLSFPAAHCGNVPISGYLLGGGLGWNGDVWGYFASVNIHAVELVTPGGEFITANEEQNQDWYWLARGAGPNFCGVVTRFHLKLYSMPQAIMNSSYTWYIEQAEEAAAWLESLSHNLPLNVELLTLVTSLADSTNNIDPADAFRTIFVASATVFANSPTEARTSLAAFASGNPVQKCIEKTEFQTTNFEELYEWDAASFPWARWSADNIWSNTDLTGILTRLRDQFVEVPSPRTTAVCLFKRNTAHLPDAALSRKGSFYVSCYANWDHEVDDQINISWIGNTMNAIDDITVGHYINETDYVNHPERGIEAFSPANVVRIRNLKRKLDPENLFHDYLRS